MTSGSSGANAATSCPTRQIGENRILFAEQVLDLLRNGDLVARLARVIDELVTVGINALKTAAVKPYPLLGTLSQWFHPEDFALSDLQAAKRLKNTVARALARIRRAYSYEAEALLESEPQMMMGTHNFIGDESPGEMANFGAQGMMAIVFMPTAPSGLVTVLQRICGESTDAEEAVHWLGDHFLDPHTMGKLAEWDGA